MLTSEVLTDLKPGDLVLYKNFTETYWDIGIFHHKDERNIKNFNYYVITCVNFDEFDINKSTDELAVISPCRYVRKLHIKAEK